MCEYTTLGGFSPACLPWLRLPVTSIGITYVLFIMWLVLTHKIQAGRDGKLFPRQFGDPLWLKWVSFPSDALFHCNVFFLYFFFKVGWWKGKVEVPLMFRSILLIFVIVLFLVASPHIHPVDSGQGSLSKLCSGLLPPLKLIYHVTSSGPGQWFKYDQVFMTYNNGRSALSSDACT